MARKAPDPSLISARATRSVGVAVPDSPALPPLGRIAVTVVAAIALAVGITSGIGFLASAPYAVVGAFLAIRRPRNTVGWLLLGLASAFALAFVNVPATTAELLAGDASAPAMTMAVVQGWAGNPLLVLFFAITVVFPTGSFPTGRWSGLSRLALAVTVLFAVLAIFSPTISVNVPGGPASGQLIPNPLAIFADSPSWLLLSTGSPIVFALVVAGVVSMVLRFRRSGGDERAQFRWLVWSVAFICVGLVVGIVGDTVWYDGLNGLVWLPAEIAFPLPPIAIGIAVLRYRLYEIDRLISRTISWAIVTLILGAIFAAVILLSQLVIAPFTGANQLAIAGSTLIVAALFGPIRGRVQQFVDRRFNRSRYDAEQTVAALAGRLRDEVNIDALREHVLTTVDSALGPSGSSLWLRD